MGGKDKRGEVERSGGAEEGVRHGCRVCEKEGREGKIENWIQCDWCGIRFSQKCGGVSEILFNVLASFEESGKEGTGLHWYCSDCYGGVKIMVSESRGVGGRQSVGESEVGDLMRGREGEKKGDGEGERRGMEREGMFEDLEAVGRGGGEGDLRSMRKDVEEIVERAFGKLRKELTSVQARQGVMEREMNTVRVVLVEESQKVEGVEESVGEIEERMVGLEGRFGKYGGRLDDMENGLRRLTEIAGELERATEERMDMVVGGLRRLAETDGELVRAAELRLDRWEEELGKFGGRLDKMESGLRVLAGVGEDMREVGESTGQVVDGGRLASQAGDPGELGIMAYMEILATDEEWKVVEGRRNKGRGEVRSKEEMGRSIEGEKLLSVAKDEQGEQGGEGVGGGGREVLCEGPVSVASVGVRDGRARVSEEEERQSRRWNLVFWGIKEGSAEEDERLVREVVCSLVGDECVGIRVVGRVGRKGGKVRPIRVVVEEAGQRGRILARAKTLKTMAGREGIYITPDRTWKQQEEDRVLRDKVKAFRSKGKEGVKISRGEVVAGEGEKREVLFKPVS